MKITRGAALATIAAGLITSGCADVSGTSNHASNNSGPVHCYGINACKGKSQCKTPTASCKAENSCKGQGWVSAGYTECLNQGGRIVDKD